MKNITNVSNIETHLYHSKSDLKIPYTMSVAIAKKNKIVNLHILEYSEHNSVYENVKEEFWKTLLHCDS
jgi:hypothetical protein